MRGGHSCTPPVCEQPDTKRLDICHVRGILPHYDLKINHVMYAIRALRGQRMELLGHLMSELHEWHGIQRRKPQRDEHACVIADVADVEHLSVGSIRAFIEPFPISLPHVFSVGRIWILKG